MAKTRKSFRMSNQPRKELSDLQLDRVSLVPSGDDPMAHVVLSKADPNMSTTYPTLDRNVSRQAGGSRMAKNDAGEEVITKDDLPEEVREYIDLLEDALDATITKSERYEAIIKAADFDPDDEGEDDVDNDADDTGTVDQNQVDSDHGAGGNKSKGKKPGTKAGVAEPNAGTSKGAPVFDLSKSDPAVREYIEKMERTNREAIEKAEKRAQEAETIAKAERTERLMREFVSKAQALPMIAENPNDLGVLLMELHALDPAVATKMETVLKAANEAITKGDLFSEIGRYGGATTMAPEVESAANEIRKSDPTMTNEQAMAKAYELNPDLYDAEMREARQNGR
jgi:hypothetical protein